ncbi:histone-fold-containing protein [Cryomyces antarcticus]
MASPPNYSATSPPYPGTLSLPRKRPSLGPPNPSAPKRQKSLAAQSAHPLRQTSFPPEASGSSIYSRSPSVESSVAGSAITSSAPNGAKKRGRGRLPKNDDGTVRSTPAGSVRGGKGGSAAPTGAGSVVAGEGAADEEEAEEEGGEVNTMLEGGKMSEAAQTQEREHLSLLVQALSPDQAERYDIWRRVRLKKETVRKITNQTLSQSVPASVVTTINGYTKVFIGEIIDRAREVQTEWMAASLTLPTGELNVGGGYEERDRGPLTPDHLREALRRYKKDREGGGAGFQGLSLEGRENTASRMGGKRLFR